MIHSAMDVHKRAKDTLKDKITVSVVDNIPSSSSSSVDVSDLEQDIPDDEIEETVEAKIVRKSNTPRPFIDSFNKFSKKYELLRKLFHTMTGWFTIWLYANGYNQRQLVIPLIVMATCCFLQDFIRFRSPAYNKVFIKTFGFMMRESEVNKYNGILFFLLGIILTSGFLPKDLSVLCNLLLSWADTSALFFGRMFGRNTPKIAKDKSLAGCIASFSTGAFACYLVYGYLVPNFSLSVDLEGDIMYNSDHSALNLHVFAILTGLIASISEGINIYDIDDNFTIPVVSGICLYSLVSVTETP